MRIDQAIDECHRWVRELLERGVLRPPHYLPGYLDRITIARGQPVVRGLLGQDRIPLRDLLSLRMG